MSLSIRLAEDSDRTAWEQFALALTHHHAVSFQWREILRNAFGHEPHYLIAEDAKGQICGICPCFVVKSLLFGTALIATPYLNGGGIVANDNTIARALFAYLEELGLTRKAKYLEIRGREQDILDDANVVTKTHKVAMLIPLLPDPDAQFASFSSKLRSQIRRPQKAGAIARTIAGSAVSTADIAAFYAVFSENMRDLGTPVYPISLFEETLKQFGERAQLSLVYAEDKPVAAGITIRWGDVVEIPWASSLRSFNSISVNMLLYWEVIRAACVAGAAQFDFGRSTPDSGPFKFKRQWGAEPLKLHWQYSKKFPTIPDINPNSKKFALLVSLWQKLPRPISNSIGPIISRSLP